MKQWSPAIATLALCACSSSPSPPVMCAKVGTGAPAYRILVMGESWAAGGRLLPELPQAVAKRAKATVLACSVGYSGMNTSKIIHSYSPEAPLRALGGKPTNVVILSGVNDQIQHRGAENYAAGMRTLATSFAPASVQVVSPPNVNMHPPLGVLYRIKNRLYGILHPDGNTEYRRDLSSAFPSAQIIDVAPFSSGADKEPARYAVDGIHLTLPEFHKYGAFIGERVNLK
jgi:hypothetical protein